jgi:hypothetical protein
MLTDEQRAAVMAQMGNKGDNSDYDGAIRILAKALKEPNSAPMPDHRPELHHIEEAIREIKPIDIGEIGKALASLEAAIKTTNGKDAGMAMLSAGINGLIQAVSSLSIDVDISPIQSAIEENTAALREMTQAFLSPKRLVLDDNNRVIGTEAGRAKGRGLN